MGWQGKQRRDRARVVRSQHQDGLFRLSHPCDFENKL